MDNQDNAGASEEITPEIDEGAAPEGTTELTSAQIAEQLESLKQQVLDGKRKISEMGEENSRLRGAPPPEPVKDYLEDFTEEALLTNPHLAIKALQQTRQDIIRQVAAVMREQDTQYRQQFGKLDPEAVALKDEIEELRKDPDLAALDTAILVKLAKRERTSRPARAPGRVPGGGARVAAGGGAGNVKDSPLFREIYGDRFVEKK